eukprot:m51a1_g13939 hypothetical protein (261) ;mRNA; f:879363-880383
MGFWIAALGTVVAAAATAFFAIIKFRLWAGRRCAHNPDLTGKVAVITGATGAVGFETAARLVRLGASVVLLDRDPERSRAAALKLGDLARVGASAVAVECDLSDLDSVRAAAAKVIQQHSEVHFLVNNAGVLIADLAATKQGWESHYGVNHLGHFALTQALLPALLAGKARVVCVSCSLHLVAPKCGIDLECLSERRVKLYGEYNAWRATGQSKLAVVLFAGELDRRYADQGLHAFSAHPGFVPSKAYRNVPLWSLMSLV